MRLPPSPLMSRANHQMEMDASPAALRLLARASHLERSPEETP